MLNPILDRWRLFAVVASVAMLAIAHAFERFGGYAPCLLCLRQREVYWTAIGVGVIAMILVRTPPGARLRALTSGALALVFLVGAGIAIYHAGAEWKFWPGPTACAATNNVSAGSMDAFLKGEPVRAISCEDAAWVFAGLSMAGWNALISLGLAALGVLAALRDRRRTA